MQLLLETKEGETKWSNDRQGIRYFLTFNLLDGTSISKSYWVNTGAFGSCLMLSDLFKEKVNEALKKSPYTLGNTIGIHEPLVLTGEMFEVSITIEPEIKAGSPMTIDGVYYQGVGYENTLAYQKVNNNPPLTDELESLYQSTFETRIPIFITYDE